MTNNDLIIEIVDSLEYLPNDTLDINNFSNGACFVQQDPIVVESLKVKLVQHYGSYDFGILGRYLSDGGYSLYKCWSRLSNCDKLSREWGQQYYAINPNNNAECYNPDFYKKLVRKNRNRKLKQIEKTK